MGLMDATAYDAWYDTSRGRWIGTVEFRLLSGLLHAQPGDTLLDVGCGTGWFTRRFAEDGLRAAGLDSNQDWLAFARAKGPPEIRWIVGDARALPFPDYSFDQVVSVAALCFVDDERRAVAEIVRVARRRFAIGWLNRTSLLYAQKGQGGGSGAYHGRAGIVPTSCSIFSPACRYVDWRCIPPYFFLPGTGWRERWNGCCPTRCLGAA